MASVGPPDAGGVPGRCPALAGGVGPARTAAGCAAAREARARGEDDPEPVTGTGRENAERRATREAREADYRRARAREHRCQRERERQRGHGLDDGFGLDRQGRDDRAGRCNARDRPEREEEHMLTRETSGGHDERKPADTREAANTDTMKADIRGTLRNITLPPSQPLLPLFEAVVNAVEAIDGAGGVVTPRIRIEAIRGEDPVAPDEAAFTDFPAGDCGGAFAQHGTVTDGTGMRAFSRDPHSPWQRGGIGNANGLVRRDLPRKTGLADYTDADIDDVIRNLDPTPRKCPGYRTPIEAFAENPGVAPEM